MTRDAVIRPAEEDAEHILLFSHRDRRDGNIVRTKSKTRFG